MMIHQKKHKRFITTKIIAYGFFLTILVGSLLLMLPICQSGEMEVSYIDALFTATTSVCVTGLVTLPTYLAWSGFGQFIILILVEIGGLGIITFTMLFLLIMGKKIGLRERMLIADAYNIDTSRGLVILVKRIVLGTLAVQGVGALLYMIVFVPEFGLKGIWHSIFLSASAFCNAGMDTMFANSLEPYVFHPLVNFTSMALIILGGIGYPVWWYFLERLRLWKNNNFRFIKAKSRMPLSVKIAVSVSLFLIFGGMLIILGLEYNNPDTLGKMNFWQKLQAALFQSITLRTAGFFTIPQENFRISTSIVHCIWMFIGGPPSGTAGGIKTTTITVLMLTIISILRGRDETESFHRSISGTIVRKAMSIFAVSFTVLLVSTIALAAVQPDANFMDCLYETISAISTIGLTRAFTGELNLLGKIIIIVTMYIGRIGPISLSLFFNTGRNENLIRYPEENVSVG